MQQQINLRYSVAVRTRNLAKRTTDPFEVSVETTVFNTVALCKWSSEANRIATLLARDWSDWETGDVVDLVVLYHHDDRPPSVLFTYETAQRELAGTVDNTPPAGLNGGEDIEWEPYDGVPADTTDFPTCEELLARDRF